MPGLALTVRSMDWPLAAVNQLSPVLPNERSQPFLPTSTSGRFTVPVRGLARWALTISTQRRLVNCSQLLLARLNLGRARPVSRVNVCGPTFLGSVGVDDSQLSARLDGTGALEPIFPPLMKDSIDLQSGYSLSQSTGSGGSYSARTCKGSVAASGSVKQLAISAAGSKYQLAIRPLEYLEARSASCERVGDFFGSDIRPGDGIGDDDLPPGLTATAPIDRAKIGLKSFALRTEPPAFPHVCSRHDGSECNHTLNTSGTVEFVRTGPCNRVPGQPGNYVCFGPNRRVRAR